MCKLKKYNDKPSQLRRALLFYDSKNLVDLNEIANANQSAIGSQSLGDEAILSKSNSEGHIISNNEIRKRENEKSDGHDTDSIVNDNHDNDDNKHENELEMLQMTEKEINVAFDDSSNSCSL